MYQQMFGQKPSPPEEPKDPSEATTKPESLPPQADAQAVKEEETKTTEEE